MVNGPDFKVGKTDIVDSNGNRVVTSTSKTETCDNKSIWTIVQETDFDHDGVMDEIITSNLTYDENGRLLKNEKRKQIPSENSNLTYKIEYIYDTETGNLVRDIFSADEDEDGNIDYKHVRKFDYNEDGQRTQVQHEFGL